MNSENPIDLQKIINCKLSEIFTWLKIDKFSFDVRKTHHDFTNKRKVTLNIVALLIDDIQQLKRFLAFF